MLSTDASAAWGDLDSRINLCASCQAALDTSLAPYDMVRHKYRPYAEWLLLNCICMIELCTQHTTSAMSAVCLYSGVCARKDCVLRINMVQ